MIHVWRLSEGGKDNLGVCCSEDGLVLGTTPLIERRDNRFVVRERHEIDGCWAVLIRLAHNRTDLTLLGSCQGWRRWRAR